MLEPGKTVKVACGTREFVGESASCKIKDPYTQTVRPTVHTNPSRKRSFSKTLFGGYCIGLDCAVLSCLVSCCVVLCVCCVVLHCIFKGKALA